MGKQYTGVWATFEYLDDCCNAIEELRKDGHEKLTTHSPCPRHEIDHALGDPQSRVPFFTLVGGLTGFVTAFLIISWMTLQWILPVSGKPLVSLPPTIVIGFEMTVLFGAFATMFGVVLLILKDTFSLAFPKSDAYKQYPRFTRDRFGIIVRCDQKKFEAVKGTMNKFQAEEVHDET